MIRIERSIDATDGSNVESRSAEFPVLIRYIFTQNANITTNIVKYGRAVVKLADPASIAKST
jgi:hypothetical protein